MCYLMKPFTSEIASFNNTIKLLISKELYHHVLYLYKLEFHRYGFPFLSHFSIIPSVIKASSSFSSSHSHHFGLQLHSILLKSGSHSDLVISNSLISMYSKLGFNQHAHHLFDTMPYKDSITWNSIINCFVLNAFPFHAFQMFNQMRLSGFLPKPELSATIISLCGKTHNFKIGRQIHALVIVDGTMKESTFLSTAFLDFYFKCDDSLMALRVFHQMEVRNEVSWTALISGCIVNQNYEMALDCYRDMQLHGIKPNRVTALSVLPACGESGFVGLGKQIHGYALRQWFDSDHRFTSAIISMYGKFREELYRALIIFERSSIKDVVMWSSIIGSHCQSKYITKAMMLFRQMRVEGIKPNSVTLMAIVSNCTTLSSLYVSHGVHGVVLKYGFNSDISIANSLVDMYAKCGSLGASHQIFKEMEVKDCVSWSTLINGYGLHGCGEKALEIFHNMKEEGIDADGIVYLALLFACNHGGLVEAGQQIFEQLVGETNIPLTIEHYACLIDLLGRSGKVEDACEIVKAMPMKPSTRIWSSLVSACKDNGRLKMAEMLALQLIELEPGNAANYALLSMVYAETGNWNGVEEVRRVMRERGLKKCYGFSQIEPKRHSFPFSKEKCYSFHNNKSFRNPPYLP